MPVRQWTIIEQDKKKLQGAMEIWTWRRMLSELAGLKGEEITSQYYKYSK